MQDLWRSPGRTADAARIRVPVAAPDAWPQARRENCEHTQLDVVPRIPTSETSPGKLSLV